jgi:hypothetical protein
MKLHELDVLIKAVCPIDGLDSSGRIMFPDAATAPQRAAAQAVFDANWPIDGTSAQDAADATAKVQAKTDTVIQYLRDHTVAECEAYVQANVTDLASARALMKKFAVALCVLAKQSLR